MLKPLTDQEFDAAVAAKGVVLVDFWAPWCGPCKMLAPVLDNMATKFAGKAEFYSVNCDENPESPTKLHVRGIPTVVIYKDGVAQPDNIVGVQDPVVYDDAIRAVLG